MELQLNKLEELAKYIKRKFIVFFRKLLKSHFFAYLVAGLLFIASGYAYSVFIDQVIRAIAAFLAFIISSIICVGNIDIETLKHRFDFKKAKIYPSFIILLIFGISTIVTILVNSDYINIQGYLIHGLLLVTAYVYVNAFSFELFKKTFLDYMFAISLFSLFFYILSKLSNLDFGLNQFTNSNGNVYANYFFIFFQNIYLDRMQGPFWEPGLFSSFLLIAMFFEIVDKKKINFIRLLLLFICLVLTKSTFSYLSFVLILSVFLYRYLKNENVKLIFFISFILLTILSFVFSDRIISILATILPDIFGKIDQNSISLTTRILSPIVNLNIFIDNFFFGAGFSQTFNLYPIKIEELGFSGLLDAQTSTSTFFMAVFGFPGSIYTFSLIIVPFFIKKYDFFTKFTLSFLFLLIVNKEPHYGILLTFVFMFYFIVESWDSKARIISTENHYSSKTTIFEFLRTPSPNQKLAINVITSIALKGSTLLISFFSIRVFSAYFNNTNSFGLWLTILSIIGWIMTFDLGLGNGLKNKLIESVNKKDDKKSKELISSTYCGSAIISLFIIVIGLILIFSFNLNDVFNISSNEINPLSLKIIVIITLFGITLEFVFKNIIYILHAFQKQYYSGFFPLFSSTFLIIFALLFRFNNVEMQLYSIAIFYSVIHSLVYIFPTIFIFIRKLKHISPSFKSINWTSIKDVMNLGIVFFIIQLTLLLINSTDTIFISNLYGPNFVVEYTYYSKLYTILTSIFIVISTTLWASIKKAYVEKKFIWIKKIYKNLLLLAFCFSILSILTIVFFQIFINFWLGRLSFSVDYFIVTIFILHTIFTFFIASFSAMSNGIQTLKSQLIGYLIGAIIKVLLTYSLARLIPNTSWILIIILHLLCYLPFLVIVPININKKLKEAEKKYV